MARLLFGINPIGLGHAARSVAIATELRKKGHEITFLSGGNIPIKFILKHGFLVYDILSFPEFTVNEKGVLINTTIWMIKYILAYKRAKKRILSEVPIEDYDVIIVDEEFAAASAAKFRDTPYIIISDIIRSHFAQNPISRAIERRTNEWFYEFFREAPLSIIPEDEGDFEGPNINYTGPFVRKIEISRETLRSKWGFDNKTILLTAGGSSIGKFLFKRVIKTFIEIYDEFEKPTDLIIAAPTSVSVPEHDHIKYLGFVRDLHEVIYSSDLVITLAGKTTIDECMIYGTPFIAIPIKNHFEQERNAARVGYSYEDLYRLNDLILEKIALERQEQKKNNLGKVVSLIDKFINEIVQ